MTSFLTPEMIRTPQGIVNERETLTLGDVYPIASCSDRHTYPEPSGNNSI